MGPPRRSLGAEWRRRGGELRERKWRARTGEGRRGSRRWRRMWWGGDGKWRGKLRKPLMDAAEVERSGEFMEKKWEEDDWRRKKEID